MNLPPACTILIRADESAFWTVAGLRQLDRIFRALNESLGEPAAVWVEWDAAIPEERRWVPPAGESGRIDLRTSDAPSTVDLVLSTHQFLSRNAPVVRRSVADLRAQWSASETSVDWEYLHGPNEISACEKRFLGGSGKSQDGLVSRFLNRPISRAVSRVLLKFPVTPSGWTIAILVLPLVAALLLARGDYARIVAGLFLFQLYSILDGCDGEIARAKYLESSFGRRLDSWCDVLGNLILAVSLGYGLSRSYFVEGVVVAALIATNELILALPAPDRALTTSLKSAGAIYPRHQRMVEHSGLLVLGPRVAGWLIQLTKRDVAIFAFLLLGIAGEPAWILHLLGAVAAISTLLALKARLASNRAR
jgi:phosphatidylglycerophosphate synthase